MVDYGPKWYIMVRNGILWYEMGYYGTKWDIMVRNGILYQQPTTHPRVRALHYQFYPIRYHYCSIVICAVSRFSIDRLFVRKHTQDIPTTSSHTRRWTYDEFGASSGDVSSADHV